MKSSGGIEIDDVRSARTVEEDPEILSELSGE
jgi:hypothetical protein